MWQTRMTDKNEYQTWGDEYVDYIAMNYIEGYIEGSCTGRTIKVVSIDFLNVKRTLMVSLAHVVYTIS